MASSREHPSIDVAAILARRSGDALDLHHRYLNRQMVRVLMTIGFDRDWVAGDGAHLVDAKGDRYLDLLSGYGVFALGRNPPAVRAQLERVLQARTPNLPQLGVTILPGVLAEELVRRSPDAIETARLTNSGAESVEGAIKMARAA